MSDQKDKLSALEKAERQKIITRVNLLRSRLTNISNKLEAIKSEKKEEAFVPKDDRPDNVYFIMPDAFQDYSTLSKTSMPFIEFVACFEVWTARLECLITLNRTHLKNKALMNHMEETLKVCQIIDLATKSYFGE